ncbi:hypothetical protein BD309DRAFT_845496, partial [Dichomitus squalens]
AQATFKSIKPTVPLFDCVLIQRSMPETKTALDIFLPSSTDHNPLPEATVITVGPGAPNKDGNVLPAAVNALPKPVRP